MSSANIYTMVYLTYVNALRRMFMRQALQQDLANQMQMLQFGLQMQREAREQGLYDDDDE